MVYNQHQFKALKDMEDFGHCKTSLRANLIPNRGRNYNLRYQYTIRYTESKYITSCRSYNELVGVFNYQAVQVGNLVMITLVAQFGMAATPAYYNVIAEGYTDASTKIGGGYILHPTGKLQGYIMVSLQISKQTSTQWNCCSH
jgi:hypothetical protein